MSVLNKGKEPNNKPQPEPQAKVDAAKTAEAERLPAESQEAKETAEDNAEQNGEVRSTSDAEPGSDAEAQNQIARDAAGTAQTEAPIRTSIDTASAHPEEPAIVAAVDQAPDADTTMLGRDDPRFGELVDAEIARRAAVVEAEANGETLSDGDTVTYTSHPTANFKLTEEFKFESGTMKIPAAKQAEFEELLKTQPLSIFNMIQRIDAVGAEDIIAKHRQGKMMSGVDTTANQLGGAFNNG